MTNAVPDAASSAERGEIALAGRRYTVERDFGLPPPAMVPARVSQLAVDSEGHVHVLRRGDPLILVFAPDGVFLPPPKPRCTELIVKKACDKLGIICIPSRLAILTKSVNGRLPCHYCGQCGRGCVTASNFSSSQVMIPPAMKTGKLTMVTGAMAREVLIGPDGKATGVP